MTELYGDHMMSQEKDYSIREYLVVWAILVALMFLVLWVLRGLTDGNWAPGFAVLFTGIVAVLSGVMKLVMAGWRRWRSGRVDSGV